MKINKLIAIIILALLVCMVAGTWGVWLLLRPDGTAVIGVPVGDDMATQIKKGTTIYTTANVPAFVLNGTSTFTADFSATVKVLDVLDTRTIRVMTLSPTMFEQQSGNVGYLYLCTPLSEKARKLSDGTIVYGGNGYPQIITGQSYDVVGVLQHPWQDDPRAYIPTALQFKQNLADSIDTQMFIDAARSFAEQAAAAGGHHMTAEPVITVDSKYVQAGKMEVMMLVKTMTALNSGSIDDEPMIAGELQYLRDHSTTLSVAAKKAVEGDIAYWRGTIKSAMTGSSEANYMIKIVADVDATGNIDASSLQVYADEGPPRGSAWVLAAQYFKNIRSAWATVAQGYASAASLASGASARITMMERTNVTSSGDLNAPSTRYDAVPFTWDVAQNTLRSSGTAALHVNDAENQGNMLLWCSGSPLLAVQQWSYRGRLPCVTATSKDVSLLALPVGMQYALATQDASTTSESMAYWYTPEQKAFVATPSQLVVTSSQKTLDGTTMTITECALASGSKAKRLTVPVPAGMWQIVVAYVAPA